MTKIATTTTTPKSLENLFLPTENAFAGIVSSATTTATNNKNNKNNNFTAAQQQRKQQQQQQQPHLPYLILHMGPDKTGTTSVQAFLERNRDLALNQDRYFTGWSRAAKVSASFRYKRSEIMNCLVQQAGTCSKSNTPKQQHQWKNNLEALKNSSYNHGKRHLIFSDESFRWMMVRNNDDWNEFLRYTQQYFRVQVILVYRRYFEWIYSRYNQEWKTKRENILPKLMHWPKSHCKRGHVTPNFERYYQWERYGTCGCQGRAIKIKKKLSDEWTCKVYFANRFDNETKDSTQQQVHPTVHMQQALESQGVQVRVVNYHNNNNNSTIGLLEKIFCQAVPNATHSCQKAKAEKGFDAKNPSAHTSIYHDQIALTAYQMGLITNENVTRSSARNQIFTRITKDLQIPYSEFPITCMEGDDLEALRRFSYENELRLAPSMATEHDQAFEIFVSKKKYCNVDAAKILEDEGWRSFLSSMHP